MTLGHGHKKTNKKKTPPVATSQLKDNWQEGYDKQECFLYITKKLLSFYTIRREIKREFPSRSEKKIILPHFKFKVRKSGQKKCMPSPVPL